MSRLPTLSAVLAAGILSATAAYAAGPACGSFTLVGGEKAVNAIDNPPAGKSIGDVRAGWRKLADESGKTIGAVHFVATLTAPGDKTHGDALSGRYFVTLPDGWIAALTFYRLANAADTSQKAGNAILVVAGGTGAYAGARGTITIEAGTAPRYVFDLTCKG